MLPLLKVTLPLWTSGCATAPASEPAIVATSNPCDSLPVPQYTHDFNVRVANELAGLPPAARLRAVVHDYAMTRDAIRACRSVGP
jgi:hypothetical protein